MSRSRTNIEAMLKHARKRMQQRAGKPLAKHARETMTNQNDTSQAKLTDDQIEVLAKKHIAPHADRLDKLLPHRVPYRQTEQFRRVKALIGDVLSRLRAPVAPSEVMDALNWVDDFIARCNRDDRGSCESVNVLRRALASAPVADERTGSDIDWQLLRDTATLVRDRFSAALDIAYANSDASRAAKRRANETHGALMAMLDAALASAPASFDRQQLRALVDVVWNEATESTAVPDTPWADRLIDKVFQSLPASAPVADEEEPPVAPDDEAAADAWISASDADGIAYDGPSFERGYRAGEIAERDRAPVAGEAQLLAMVWRISAAEARAYWEVATAATLEGCARELESLDAAPQASKAAGEEPQPVAVVRDHPEDYGTLIDALVALPVGTQLYAAPQASADLVRNSALGDAIRAVVYTYSGKYLFKITRAIHALKLQKDGNRHPLLAPAHTGMRVDYRGLLSQARDGLRAEPGLAEMLRQLQDHLQELGERWYDGDMAVVDELLQLYGIESKAREALAEKGGPHG